MLTAGLVSAFLKDNMRMARYIASGIVCALGIGVLTFLFTGAGHGWTSGVYSAFPSFVGAPLAAVAWASSQKAVTLACSSIAILIGLGTDLFLFFSTLEEGSNYLGRVWEAMPFLLAVWVLLFAGWQMVAISAAFKRS
ncbi:hypothetical protein [Prosthecobacter vanneervenii]|uniref:Uncharacterized protein n=1 Tax=Prosthecobacter vanneervenii TaxID=48466 RepID=A0A7W7YAF0_9BACT|nr:hypothetical protein [Prosthecobacter vanneervenii]MBB5032578.1 hypothetical protein [Prosthecobacter vanneervenii]